MSRISREVRNDECVYARHLREYKSKSVGLTVYRTAVNVCMASLHPWYMFLSCSLIMYDGVGCVLVAM